ncbi:MAG: hypothetical protein IJR89_02095 [Clostridia bacterium]|nr:hypothetical protein [Clostridia bacterium]
MKRTVIGIVVLAGLVLYCTFSTGGFVAGMRALGDIVNIFGTVFVELLKAIFAIPEMAQEITKRIITTILVWAVYGFGLRGTEKKIAWGVMGAVASVICTVLSWVGMF